MAFKLNEIKLMEVEWMTELCTAGVICFPVGYVKQNFEKYA